ncbi:MAG: purine-nucleoside phosphorylase [Rikenellaceae bacterium]
MRLNTAKLAAEYISQQSNHFTPKIGVVLGSGLGGFASEIEVQCEIDYSEIPEFPISTVDGHKGKLILGYIDGVKVIAMQGRFHYYEGYTMDQVTLPIRVFKLLGIEYLLLSNASGGINMGFEVGDLMVITDHINLMPNPLIGQNIADLGPRFPDMHGCYDPELISIADKIAAEKGIKLQHGVYVGGTGPTFETQAEYKYMGIIGGDAAGMSTVPEVIVARHMSIPTFGISVITNIGLSDQIGDHEDVQTQGAKAAKSMAQIFTALIKNLE